MSFHETTSTLTHRVSDPDSAYDDRDCGGVPNRIRRSLSGIHRSLQGSDSREEFETSGHVGDDGSMHR